MAQSDQSLCYGGTYYNPLMEFDSYFVCCIIKSIIKTLTFYIIHLILPQKSSLIRFLEFSRDKEVIYITSSFKWDILHKAIEIIMAKNVFTSLTYVTLKYFQL